MADSKISALASGAPAQSGDEFVVARSGANYKLTLGNMAASMPPLTVSGDTSLNGAVVINEAGADKDTRIEGDADVNLVFVDASTDRVGLGTSTPAEKLDIASGNLIFSGTAQRVLADFGGDWATRLIFQNKTTDGDTRVTAIPNGTSQIASFSLSNSSTPTNSVTASLRADSTAVSVSANSEGSATPLPLEFRTTSVAGSPGNTRMAISPDGNVGIGGTASAFDKVTVTGTLPTSSNVSVGYGQRGTIPSGTTSQAASFSSFPSTQAASFTLNQLVHYWALQNALGAGSAITNQMGFFADPSLTGATNNYGFYGNIASGSNRYNVYMAGTADNYFAGNVGIGMTPSTDTLLEVYGSAAATCYKNTNTGTGLSDGFYVGCGKSSSTDAYVYNRESASIIFGTANIERMRIDSEGRVGIGGTAGAATKLNILGTLPTSGTVSFGVGVTGTIPSGSTSGGYGFSTGLNTEAASFTLGELRHFSASQATIGAGSTVTNQFGFIAGSNLTGATNNFGFYSDIASGSNRWGFYSAGTADNYFAGNVGIGTSPSTKLHVAGTAAADNIRLLVANSATDGYSSVNVGDTNAGLYRNGSAQTQYGGANSLNLYTVSTHNVSLGTNNTERMRITSDGEVLIAGGDNGPYNLQCNATGVWGAGAYVNGSDARLKDDITTLNDGLNVVSQLRPVTFKYKPDYSKDQNVQTGFIAQELQAVLAGKDYVDGIVQAGPTHLNVAYQSLIPILVKAIQELTARVAELEAK